MRTTIDQAGRIVIPKELRDRVGLTPGEVEIDTENGSIIIEPVRVRPRIEYRDGRPVIVDSGPSMTVAEIRAIRLGLQR